MNRFFVVVAIFIAASTITACSSGGSGFSADLGAVGTDQGSIAHDAISGNSSGDFTALGSDCNRLLADVGKLQSDSVPSYYTSTMQTELSNMESDNTQGANDCVQAVNSNDQTTLAAAVQLFSAASTQENQLTSQLNSMAK